MWQKIETAPREFGYIVGYRKDWDCPAIVTWKTNDRIVRARAFGEDVGDLADSYFGDPWESDDYDSAKPGGGPTHWMPLPPFPD